MEQSSRTAEQVLSWPPVATTNPRVASHEQTGVAPEATAVLLERVRSGDRGAVEVLVARYLPALRRWASGRLPQWARDLRDTDDLVQDTLVAALRNLATFEVRQDGALHAYLRQSISNRIRDELRRVGRRPVIRPADDELEDRSMSPLEKVIGSQALQRYERALALLSPAEREALLARVELGLSYNDIAAALGKSSPDAARMTVSRAVLRMAREMDRG
jgi:RNA polymerase sigma factor (sigma-70 family)